jgi:hypothetical protein
VRAAPDFRDHLAQRIFRGYAGYTRYAHFVAAVEPLPGDTGHVRIAPTTGAPAKRRADAMSLTLECGEHSLTP